MPQSRTCDYCGGDIDPGTGTMFVRVDGSVTHFCSSKCEKNAGLGRESRNLEWTQSGRSQGDRAAGAPDRSTEEPATAEPVDTVPESGGDADEPSDGGEDGDTGADEPEPADDEPPAGDDDAAPPEDDENAAPPGT